MIKIKIFDLKVETHRRSMTARLNEISSPFWSWARSQRHNNNVYPRTVITFLPSGNLPERSTTNCNVTAKGHECCTRLDSVSLMAEINVYNFHCNKERKKKTWSHYKEEGTSSRSHLKLTTELPNSDPEVFTVFSSVLDGKIMKAIHHREDSRPAYILHLLWEMHFTATFTI